MAVIFCCFACFIRSFIVRGDDNFSERVSEEVAGHMTYCLIACQVICSVNVEDKNMLSIRYTKGKMLIINFANI